MENLRWFLIFAGVAILVLLWFSGRSGRRAPAPSRLSDPLLGEGPLIDEPDDGLRDVPLGDGFDGFDDFADVDPDDFARPGEADHVRRSTLPASGADTDRARHRGEPAAVGPGMEAPSASGLGGLAAKFEAIGEKLAPKRRQRVAASEPDDIEEAPPYASKIITLHVVAPADEILPPEALYEMFGQRGYHHGDMSIFHSMYEGKPVFSIARMVKPGTFDLDDITTFETPGLALILQLPGPVAADTAFEVMLSEAFEIADELGGSVLDGNRSTLGRQTEQHLREGIYEYMHRQKYFDSVAS